VHARVEGLLKDRDRHADRHLSLEEELRELKRSNEVLQARVTELEHENEVLRTVKAAPAASDRSGSKERIDELVIEIDRCLALLQN
jgi:cell division protein FtsB